MAINQIYYGNTELINLQNDTITAADVCNQKTFHLPNGTITQGTNTYDADTSDGNASQEHILKDKIAYVKGNRIVGEMLNNGSMTAGLSTKTATKIIPAGFTSGGTVSILTSEQDKIIGENIKSGINILGINGTFTNDATAIDTDILLDKTAYVNGNKITGKMLDYTTFKTYFIDAYTSKVNLGSNSRELTLPVPPSTCNFGSRPIRWISIDASIGVQTTTSTSTQKEYIISATYSYDELLLVSTVNVLFKAVTVRVGKTNSTTAAAYTQIYGTSYFNFIDFDKLAQGQAKIQINSSKMTNGYFKSGVNYFITIGG